MQIRYEGLSGIVGVHDEEDVVILVIVIGVVVVSILRRVFFLVLDANIVDVPTTGEAART